MEVTRATVSVLPLLVMVLCGCRGDLCTNYCERIYTCSDANDCQLQVSYSQAVQRCRAGCQAGMDAVTDTQRQTIYACLDCVFTDVPRASCDAQLTSSVFNGACKSECTGDAFRAASAAQAAAANAYAAKVGGPAICGG